MNEICIITVVNNKEVRFYFKEGKLNKIYKMKFGFVISSVSRKHKQIKKFKKVTKYYLNNFLENDIELFIKFYTFNKDILLNSWCSDIALKGV